MGKRKGWRDKGRGIGRERKVGSVGEVGAISRGCEQSF